MNRMTPWFYQAVLNLSVMHMTTEATGLVYVRWITSSIYFWSGFFKLNPGFVSGMFPWLSRPLRQNLLAPCFRWLGWSHLFGQAEKIVLVGGYIAGPFEMMLGIIFMGVPQFPKWLVLLLCWSMHIFILYSVSPLGLFFNEVVYPWNVAMMFQVHYVIVNSCSYSFRDSSRLIFTEHKMLSSLLAILLFLCPLFKLFDYWPQYLSWSLYSGVDMQGAISIQQTTVNSHFPQLNKYTKLLFHWGIGIENTVLGI